MRDLVERSPSPSVGGTDGVGKPGGPRLDGPADAGGGGSPGGCRTAGSDTGAGTLTEEEEEEKGEVR